MADGESDCWQLIIVQVFMYCTGDFQVPVFIWHSSYVHVLLLASYPVPRPAYRTASDEKLGVGLGTRLYCCYVPLACDFLQASETVPVTHLQSMNMAIEPYSQHL